MKTTRNLLPSFVAVVGAALLPALLTCAQATPIFTDDFQSGLGQWDAGSSGTIVADPFSGSNSVLKFTSLGSGGDIFSTAPYFAGGTYHLSFDILGTCGGAGNCGAFIGIDQFPGGEIWIAGDSTYNPKLYLMQNNGSWQHFDFVFTANVAGTFRLKLEDFVNSPPPGDVYFDNICISADANDAGCASRSVSEPGSLALAGLALTGLALRRGRKAS